jgi:uncharacterized protein with HEPN domain/predicted nucleotidyltransferase
MNASKIPAMSSAAAPSKPGFRKKPRARKRPLAMGAIVRKLRRAMPALSAKYGIQSLGLFGSYVRGEQKLTSDLDVLVEYEVPPDTIGPILDLQEELGDLLGVKVDLHQPRLLKPYIGKNVMRQAVWVQRNRRARTVQLYPGLSTKSRRSSNGGIMAAKREYLDWIQDMLAGMVRAQRYVRGLTLDDLLANEEKLDAVSYALQTIGEAANRIPVEIQKKYPTIPWKDIIGMRNWIAHGYDVIDYNTFWKTLTEAIPRDEPLVRGMLEAEKQRWKNEE